MYKKSAANHSLLSLMPVAASILIAQVHGKNHQRELGNGTMFWDLDSRHLRETMGQTFRVSIDSATTM